jgi:hypothetical protein
MRRADTMTSDEMARHFAGLASAVLDEYKARREEATAEKEAGGAPGPARRALTPEAAERWTALATANALTSIAHSLIGFTSWIDEGDLRATDDPGPIGG